MDSKIQHILHSGNCLTIEQLQLYREGKLPATERFVVEHHLLECEICSDLLEGLSVYHDANELANNEEEIRIKIHELLEKKGKPDRRITIYRRISVAAGLILICSLSVLIYNQRNNKTEMAVVEKEQNGAAAFREQKDTIELQVLAAVTPKESEKKSIQKPVAKTMSDATDMEEAAIEPEIQQDTDVQLTLMDSYQATEVALIDTQSVSVATSQPIAINTNQQDAAVPIRIRGVSSIKQDKSKAVFGIVTDENGDPIAGVNVVDTETGLGSISNEKGIFLLTGTGQSGQLNLSFVGYEPQQITYSADSLLNITMEPNTLALNEVVVVGYGAEEKKDETGSISTISMKQEGASSYDPELFRQQKMNEIEKLKNDPGFSSNKSKIKKVVIKYLQIEDSGNAKLYMEMLHQLVTDEVSKSLLDETLTLINSGDYKQAIKKLKKLNE